MLKQKLFASLNKFTDNSHLLEPLWIEIVAKYSEGHRHYHNLGHLANLILELERAKSLIRDWDAMILAAFYHDIIYKPTKNNNEEKSAELAKERLGTLSVPPPLIGQCVALILATKSHSLSQDFDVNLFTDADLSILGKDFETYSIYREQIRKEYAVYPDFLYNPGRRKVLNHFLSMDRIFKTDFFFNSYEAQARENLQKEQEMLSSK